MLIIYNEWFRTIVVVFFTILFLKQVIEYWEDK